MCGYRRSRWHAQGNLGSCVGGHSLRINLKTCNRDLGTGSLIRATGCECLFAGQWTLTDTYGGQLRSLTKVWDLSLVNEAST